MGERVVGDVRVSTYGQAREGYSLAYQAEEIERYCKQNGLEHILSTDSTFPLPNLPRGKYYSWRKESPLRMKKMETDNAGLNIGKPEVPR